MGLRGFGPSFFLGISHFVSTSCYLGMIFLSYNAQQAITLPIRNWKYGNDSLTNYGDYWRIQAKFINKDTREVITYTLVSPSFDSDTKELTFIYNSASLDPEVPYVMRLEDQRFAQGVANEYEDRVIVDNGTIESLTCVTNELTDLGVDDAKVLAIDKVYMLPSGETTATYQPVLATTQQSMNNDFVIYGE